MKKLFCAVLLLLTFCGRAQEHWQQMGDFPGIARDDASGVVCNGYGYMGTGFGFGFVYLKDWWKYDFANDTWQQLPDFPGAARQYTAIAAIDQTIYLFAGLTTASCSDELWAYNTVDGSWKMVSLFPGGGRQAPVLAAYGHKLYAGLGRCGTSYYNDWWEFDPATVTWTALTPFPGEARFDPIQSVVNENILVGAGLSATGGKQDSYEYVPVSGTWRTLQDFPGCGILHTVQAEKQGELLVICGDNDDYEICPGTYRYKAGYFSNDWSTWNIDALNPARRGGVGFLYHDYLYYTCGIDTSLTRMNKVERVKITAPAIEESKWMVYPTIAETDLYIESKNNFEISGKVYVYNLVGQYVPLQWPAEFSRYARLDVSAFPPGVYLLRIVDKHDTQVYECKFVKVPAGK